MKFTIQNSIPKDIDAIFKLYRIASEYQRSKFSDNVWPDFDPEMVKIEIKEQRQFKLLIDNQIACVWAITFNDPEIWGNKDEMPSVYIHRIATDPDFRGRNLVTKIVEWARPYAIANGREFVRLDTCGNNEGLITHYIKSGFDFLGMIKITDSKNLPSHYHDADVCLFEMTVSS